MKIYLIPSSSGTVRFVGEGGQDIDPIVALNVMNSFHLQVKRESDISRTYTRKEEFGAVSEGINTLIDVREVNIKFYIDMPNE